MCTLLVMFRVHPVAELIVAANRDEFFDRPAAGPTVLRESEPRAIGGLDLLHGGTWLGVNDRRLFAGLTNVRSVAADRRSRGEIVRAVLGATTVAQAKAVVLSSLAADRYRPFNLVFGTPEELFVAHVRDAGVEIVPVPAGLHVLVSSGVLDDPALPKVDRARGLLEEAVRLPTPPELFGALKRILTDHREPDVEELPPELKCSPWGRDLECRLQAICVHTPVYGTRSSTLLALCDRLLHYEHCEGPPCRGTWSACEPLLECHSD